MNRELLFLVVLALLLGGSFISAVDPVQAITSTPAPTPVQSTPTPPVISNVTSKNTASIITIFEQLSSFFQKMKPIVEVLAVIIGVVSAYRTFIYTRLNFPYAKLSQEITQVSLPSLSFMEDKILLNVLVTIHNTGSILIPLASSETRIQQILPLHELVKGEISQEDTDRTNPEISWPELQYLSYKWKKGEKEIEPGESEQIEYEFILEKASQVVKVYSYVSNRKKEKSGLGWHTTQIYKLEE